ncbi:MAG TPA: hypothetical protein DCM58_05295 [Desulfovibrio sp.]|nr:hypothetical protein [Desulfovibrio sp.]
MHPFTIPVRKAGKSRPGCRRTRAGVITACLIPGTERVPVPHGIHLIAYIEIFTGLQLPAERRPALPAAGTGPYTIPQKKKPFPLPQSGPAAPDWNVFQKAPPEKTYIDFPIFFR